MKRVIKAAKERPILTRVLQKYPEEDRPVITKNIEEIAERIEDELSSREGVDAEVEYYPSWKGKSIAYDVHLTSGGEEPYRRRTIYVRLSDIFDVPKAYKKLHRQSEYRELIAIRDIFFEVEDLDQKFKSPELAHIFKRMYSIPGDVRVKEGKVYANRAYITFGLSNYWQDSSNIEAQPIEMNFEWASHGDYNDITEISRFIDLTPKEFVARLSDFFDPHAAITNLCTGLDTLAAELPEDAKLFVKSGGDWGIYVTNGQGNFTYITWKELARTPKVIVYDVTQDLL